MAKSVHSIAHAQTKVVTRALVAWGWTSAIVNQMPTPVRAPSTRVSRTNPRLRARTKPRKASSLSRRAFVSATTRKSPPPTAKCEMKTWRIATAAMSKPGAGSSHTG